ncbi:MAG: hypothetical protein IJY25_01715 [Bacilli bacterium]|nr:hypothetical protein [Bacilli bacterium]
MANNRPIYFDTIHSDMNEFYSHLNEANFKGVTQKRLLYLKANSLILNKLLHNEHTGLYRNERYTKIMNKLRTRPEEFGINMDNRYAETYILFMFAVDPNFEVAIITGECNRIQEIKNKMVEYLGIYDRNLIKIESYYLRTLATEKKRHKINEEIDKRVFK